MPDTTHITVGELRDRLKEFPANAPIVPDPDQEGFCVLDPNDGSEVPREIAFIRTYGEDSPYSGPERRVPPRKSIHERMHDAAFGDD